MENGIFVAKFMLKHLHLIFTEFEDNSYPLVLYTCVTCIDNTS